MAYDPRVLEALRRHAARLPDQGAREYYVASAIVESGLRPDAVGDGGRSGGLFQEHSGGRGAGIPMSDRFNPENNARRAADEFLTFYNRGARGGDLAYRAQRPADRTSYLSKLQQAVGQAREILGGAAGTPGSAPLNAPVTGGSSGTVSQPQAGRSSTGLALASAIGAGGTGTKQTQNIVNSVIMAAMQGAGAPATSEAEGMKVNPTGLDNTLGTGDTPGAVAAARGRLGTPYSWGGGTPSGPTRGFGRGANTTGFDCSSLVQYAWAKAGVQLPRVTYDQIKVGRAIPNNMSQWKPGDLIFPHAGHVQMYIGNGKVIHAPRTGGVVEIVPVGKVMAVRRPKG